MSMVGARIAVAGQLHHGSGGRLRDGVVRSSAPVPMGQCGGTVPAVSREETLGVAFAHSHDLGGLGDGKLVFQNTVENLNPCLFLLVQRYTPHRDDMFADQLAHDRIVEHQHRGAPFCFLRRPLTNARSVDWGLGLTYSSGCTTFYERSASSGTRFVGRMVSCAGGP